MMAFGRDHRIIIYAIYFIFLVLCSILSPFALTFFCYFSIFTSIDVLVMSYDILRLYVGTSFSR